MDFFAFLWLTSLTVLLPLAGMHYSMQLKRHKLALREQREDAGLTLGELRRMIHEEVEAANAPLLDRIETLERAHGLPAPDAFDDAEGERTIGRRVAG